MIDQGIKSRPQYEPLRLDPTGKRHLLLVAEPDHRPEGFETKAPTIETWIVVPRDAEGAAGIPLPGEDGPRRFRSLRQMLDCLGPRLAQERMGLRLYATGREDFLWDVDGIARRAGMGKGEVQLSHAGSLARRVYCVHCRTYNEGVTMTIARCEGCGAHLFVRDHFSRRLSAFMGVKVDAEVPGDVPSAEQAYL
ncbi:dimethylamine monooxygenase subunit DmmA family protein [Methylobacterium sp. R2-1]|uniref:dimethylamine monooxygenase subunit DmmA family protein n=1 Tax=Methylobacterium sp. R2-1 TaxID=2587064 RepID=UPI001610C5FD|nr:dimethylamine monooxygenase subunit DmmA family protein [Methylobacterium sp. R2-1]MBB2965028.1 hypothetical protein [Methylobacterium sp. R2-1]